MSERTLAYRALSMLEKDRDCIPYRYKREPMWRPRPPKITDQVYTPTWGWEHPRKAHWTDRTVTLDVNAAYLSAASSAKFAHGPLERDTSGQWKKLPGFYLVDQHPWPEDSGICSPLGTADLGDGPVWVAAPTLELLFQVAEAGYWPGIEIHDAYTAPAVRFRSWAQKIGKDRAAVINRIIANPADDKAREMYETMKRSYSQAVQMWLIPPSGNAEGKAKKNRAYRPDWALTVWAQHAASTWRRAYIAWRVGITPIAMGNTDEITYDADDFHDLLHTVMVPPFKIDQSGRNFGTVKVKKTSGDLSEHEACCIPRGMEDMRDNDGRGY